MSAHLLVVEAESAIQELIRYNLGQAGHRVSCVANAERALAVVEAGLPDMVLLEWDLPGQSGLTLIRRLRAHVCARDVPIIMVSARDSEHDKVLALEAGADDYITKPFGAREMLARVHALLRRRAPRASVDTVQLAGLRLDPATQRVTAGARQIDLGRVEFRLLNFLMLHPERVHSRAQLLDKVWGSDVFLDERTVDTHVGRLRSALQPSGHQEHIETVRGSGYRFVWEAA
ncbi:MAG TPA: phosphate regulon transcriptional regulator PhoB [Telluria sp.]|nr:phosphate regulon transcriptional regulator PhoB [Telluria sp.]